MSLVVVEGSTNFRHALALSILSQRPTKIINIRTGEPNPGIREYEHDILTLIKKLMCKTEVEISGDGCSVYFKPGSVVGGTIRHKCCIDRPISYYLEFVTWISLYLRHELTLTLEGITNGSGHPSVDAIILSYLPLMRKFGFNEDTKITIIRRGYAPLGGGACLFYCRPIKVLQSVDMSETGKISSINGVCYCMRVSPKIASQLAETIKRDISLYIKDIRIDIDSRKLLQSGLSPGYGCVLSAKSINGAVFTAESYTVKNDRSTNNLNEEDLSKEACERLMQEIFFGGCVDSFTQTLLLIYMVSTPSNAISKACLPAPSPYISELLRLIRNFLGVTFHIKSQLSHIPSPTGCPSKIFNFGCLGAGLANVYKTAS